MDHLHSYYFERSRWLFTEDLWNNKDTVLKISLFFFFYYNFLYWVSWVGSPATLVCLGQRGFPGYRIFNAKSGTILGILGHSVTLFMGVPPHGQCWGTGVPRFPPSQLPHIGFLSLPGRHSIKKRLGIMGQNDFIMWYEVLVWVSDGFSSHFCRVKVIDKPWAQLVIKAW